MGKSKQCAPKKCLFKMEVVHTLLPVSLNTKRCRLDLTFPCFLPNCFCSSLSPLHVPLILFHHRHWYYQCTKVCRGQLLGSFNLVPSMHVTNLRSLYFAVMKRYHLLPPLRCLKKKNCHCYQCVKLLNICVHIHKPENKVGHYQNENMVFFWSSRKIM